MEGNLEEKAIVSVDEDIGPAVESKEGMARTRATKNKMTVGASSKIKQIKYVIVKMDMLHEQET